VPGCVLWGCEESSCPLTSWSVHIQGAAKEVLASALMASLPGIDANDPPKSLAAFRFYAVVLSSVGCLQVGGFGGVFFWGGGSRCGGCT
jgi:hypothetical protein